MSVTKQVAADLRAAAAYLNGRFFEREDVVECLLLASLTGQNFLMLGTPGTGKSNITDEFAQILDAKYFWQQMDLMLLKEDFFGPLDHKSYEQTGVWVRDWSDMLPEADIITLEEIGKTGPHVLTMLLTALNERKVKNGTTVHRIPLHFAVGTTNELLEDPSGAMFDRFVIRAVVDDFRDQESFKKMLRREGSSIPRPSVDFAALKKVAEVEVPAVVIPDAIIDKIAELRAALRHQHEISPSPRRFNQSMSLLRAQAFLSDRSEVNEDDLAVLRHVLWESPEQINPVTNTVLEHSTPAIKELHELSGILDDVELGMDERQHEPTTVRAAYATEVQVKMKKVSTELLAMTSTTPHVVTRIDALKVRWESIQKQILIDTMNMSPERAEQAARL